MAPDTDDLPRASRRARREERQEERHEEQTEHRRDREDLRARERTRQAASERDRRAFRERDRGRRRGGGDYRTSFEGVARDVDRLGYALVRAAARAYVGTTSAVGGLLFNLADSYYSRPYLRNEVERFDEDSRDRDSDRSARTEVRGRAYYSDYYDDLSMAVEDVADALSQSADEFVRAQRGSRERDIEAGDEDGPVAERVRGHRSSPASQDQPKEPS
ncbi:MAG: hypothetical protein K2Y27_07450 [Xanthobacteraceae bacterium]|nr:hypothetical protein [Xanthobacteraceae bacterium]